MLRYTVDPYRIDKFEHYARLWIPLVEKFGGNHHGYFLPQEGANDTAVALFSFSSLASYERYREASADDPDSQAAYRYARETRCIVRYERSFMRPVFE